MGKTKIKIDYSLCGPAGGIDPRECTKCLSICDPSVFLMHTPVGMEQEDPYNPQVWQITAVWVSLCTRCGKCEDVCPEKAISIN